MKMRTRLVGAAAMLAACSAPDSGVVTASQGPAHRQSYAVAFDVIGLTFNHHVSPPSTTIANFSGGTIYAEEVSGGTTVALGSVDGNQHRGFYTAAAGYAGQLRAVANSGCTFNRWYSYDEDVYYTTNPLNIDTTAGTSFRGEFTCNT
jgi:hypothetical protein